MTLRERIEAQHKGRDPERVAMKYALLRESPKAFYRGLPDLFYEEVGRNQVPESPIVWANGDAHLENFGVYRGDNRLAYFDLNDFDEACLAPLCWDVLRFATSVALSAGAALVAPALEAYRLELAGGKARWVERETARGSVGRLLLTLTGRSRKEFLAKRLTAKGALRKDGRYALPLIEEAPPVDLGQFGFTPIEAARRVAGNSSLGVERYVLLVERDDDAKRYLLDLKAAQKSSLAIHSRTPQPTWLPVALRIWKGQRTLQAIPPAFLHAVSGGGRSFILKELVPREDRVRLERAKANVGEIVLIEARLLAWSHLRASGHDGSAPADALIAFAEDFPREELDGLSQRLAGLAQSWYEEFRADLQ